MCPPFENVARAQEAWDSASDLRLARRCAGDTSAREELFRLHVDAVYRLASRLVGSRQDAEDVVQEAFVSIFRSLHTYRGEAPLRSWLLSITAREAARFRRRSQRARENLALLAGGEQVESAGGDDPAGAFDGRRALARLCEVLDRLAFTRRAVFVLHEVEGYSLPETAAMLGITVSAAKKRVCRARRDLERLASAEPLLSRLFETERGADG